MLPTLQADDIADMSLMPDMGVMRRNKFILTLVTVALCGCEPLRGIVSEKDIQRAVDLECVDTALRQTFGNIDRDEYVDDGSTFPKGTNVAQFTYYRTEDTAGRAALDIGRVSDKTQISHSFTGIGAALPQQSFAPAIRAMQKASFALKASCGLDLSDMQLEAVGQKVDALN